MTVLEKPVYKNVAASLDEWHIVLGNHYSSNRVLVIIGTIIFWVKTMALNIPEALLNLEANCGVFALWMIFQQYGVEIDIDELVKISGHNYEDGTFTIALAVALKKYGFEVSFYTDVDPNIDPKEMDYYQTAQKMQLTLQPALSYQQMQHRFEQGKLIIVYYDNLEGVGNQSLVYSIDEQEICFFDSFDSMPQMIFEQQRKGDGICQQTIVIEGHNLQLESIKLN